MNIATVIIIFEKGVIMKKVTFKQLEKYNEETNTNNTLFEIDVTIYKMYGEHLTIKEEYTPLWQHDDYKEALKLYWRAKWSHGELCSVKLKRAVWFKNEVSYIQVYSFDSPRLRKLYKLGYYVLY